MRQSIPPGGSIPPSYRRRRLPPSGSGKNPRKPEAGIGFSPSLGARYNIHSLRDPSVRGGKSLSLADELQAYKREIEIIASEMRDLENFQGEGLDVADELERLRRRKEKLEKLLG